MIFRYWKGLLWLLRIHSCSSGFIQDFLNHYADRCRFNDVYVGWSPIHWIIDQSIRAFCYRWLHTDNLWAPLHIIIKIYLFSNVSMPGQRCRQWPSIEPVLRVWYGPYTSFKCCIWQLTCWLLCCWKEIILWRHSYIMQADPEIDWFAVLLHLASRLYIARWRRAGKQSNPEISGAFIWKVSINHWVFQGSSQTGLNISCNSIPTSTQHTLSTLDNLVSGYDLLMTCHPIIMLIIYYNVTK